MTTYGVLGVGAIGSAIVTGLCAGSEDAPDILLSPRNAHRAAELASRFPSTRVATTNQHVIDGSDVVILCLLPVHAAEVMADLHFRPDQAVVSAIAGFSLARLTELVEPVSEIARSIPLVAVATRTGTTPLHPATPSATQLYDRLGAALTVDDEFAFDAMSAASATVASHFHYLGTIASWLVERGVPATVAHRYLAETYAALGPELNASRSNFATLAIGHSTPGGLNEQFSRHVDAAGMRDAVQSGLDALLTRITQSRPT